MIPCQHYGNDPSSFKWLYKKDEFTDPIMIYFTDLQGLPRYDNVFRPKISINRGLSLVITSFTKDDQGQYWCEYCYQGKCESDIATFIHVDKGQNFSKCSNLFAYKIIDQIPIHTVCQSIDSSSSFQTHYLFSPQIF